MKATVHYLRGERRFGITQRVVALWNRQPKWRRWQLIRLAIALLFAAVMLPLIVENLRSP